MWLVTLAVFLIFFIGPGPGAVARALAGRQATQAQVALIAHRLLLDRPIFVQYGHFLNGLVHGNLGYDYYYSQSVNSIIGAAFPITFSLVVGAAVLWLAMGVLTGVVSAVRTRSVYERTIHGIHAFPGSGYTAITANPFQWLRGLVLPWITLALVQAATYTRLSRGSMLDVLGEDYIRTARAKGLSERRVVFRHALR